MTIYAIGGGNHVLPPSPPEAPSYTVQAGDSLESIAQAQHTTVQALVQLNHLDMEHPHAVVISPGQQLQLPQPGDASPPDADPVTQALTHYEQVANSTRNTQVIASHAGQNPGDPGLLLNQDAAQTQLNQALEFQAAANQRAGQPFDPGEINQLAQHYSGLAQFANNAYAQAGLTGAATDLNSPEADAVDKIFSQVSAPSANDGNLAAREAGFAKALTNQSQDVIDAVRNDPRYQPLMDQFVSAAVNNGPSMPPPHSPMGTVAAWENQAQANLFSLANLMDGQPGTSTGLPPDIAADIVKMPQVQSLLSSVLATNAPQSSQIDPANQQQLQNWLGNNFQSMSRIADSLGTNTPAANQFTQQTAQAIVGALQTAGVPASDYSQFLNLKAELGAQATGEGTQTSPALAIAIAQQVQASGDSKSAQGIINDVCSAVNNVATSSDSYTTSVTKALGDYQAKTADLNWLVTNLGAGASPQQIDSAVQDYINRQGASWQSDYNQDKATLQNAGQFLASDITQLQNLPANLHTSQVDSTLKSLAGNKSVQQALGYALQNQPMSVLGKDGSQANPLLKFFQLDKSSASLATAVAQTYMQTRFVPGLVDNLKNLTPGTPAYTEALQGAFKNLQQQNPDLSKLIGLNDEKVNSLSTLFDQETVNARTPEEITASVTGKLKGFANDTQPILKGVALAIAGQGLFKTLKTTVNDPSAGNIISACTSALGFSQSATAYAQVFNKVSADNPFVAYGNANNDAGKLVGKLVNTVGIVTNLQSLGANIDGGNTVGTMSSGMTLTASLLKTDTLKEVLLRFVASDTATSFLNPVAGALMWGSSLISVGQMFFTSGARPPSTSDQLTFLKDLGYSGLSQNAQFALLSQTSSNPSLGTPGSSPLMLLSKYAADKGYNLQDANQRTAFVNWVNQLAATPDANNTNHIVSETGATFTQLDSLVQNLDAELDATKGDVSQVGKTDPGDPNFTQAANQQGNLSDLISGNGPDGVVDQTAGKDHVATFNSHMGENVVAPQSAYQIDQLLGVMQATALPPPPPSVTAE